jgi:hypothetical protein
MLHNIETMIKNAASTAKQFQTLTLLFGQNIGFAYQNEVSYKAGLTDLEETDTALASYLAEARKWLEPLRLLRDGLEHKPFIANRITYNRDANGNIRANEPHVMGMPITAFTPILLSRLYRYIEEVLIWCFQRTSALRIVEIPIGQRNPDKPERFKFMFSPQDQPWSLSIQTTSSIRCERRRRQGLSSKAVARWASTDVKVALSSLRAHTRLRRRNV